MADLQQMLVVDFEGFPDQEDSQNSSDIRLPDCLSAQDFTTDGPLVVDLTTGGYTVKGLHPNTATSDADTAVLYSTTLADTVEEVSFIRMRSHGNSTDFRAAPATRITSDGIGCYAAEVIWDTTDFKLEIVRYDASTGTRNILTTQTSVITSPGTDRFYAIGIKAEGTGATITLRAYVELLHDISNPPAINQWDLNGMTANKTEVASTTDSTGDRHTSGAHGIKWKTGTLSAVEQQRIVNQWGIFKDISATRPDTPSISTTVGTEGQKLTVTISGFSDSDPLDTHNATRWLLYEGLTGFYRNRWHAPLVDTGFLTGSKLSYTFQDLMPGALYSVRVQVKDDDGDVSTLGEQEGIAIDDAHSGYLRAVQFFEAVSGQGWRKPSGFITAEPGTGTSVFTLRRRTPGAGVDDPRMERFGTVPSSEHRRFVWRDDRYLTSSQNPLYATLHATMAFVKWGTGSGLWIGVRNTHADASGYYVRKQESGSNWEYLLYQRTLQAGGTPGTGPSAGPWTDTLLKTIAVAKANIGSSNGERILFVHLLDSSAVGTLALYVNGKLVGSHTPANAGGTLEAFQYHSFELDDTNGSWAVTQYGTVGATGSLTPAPNLEVLPNQRETGRGMHSPGPYMDPWDLGNANIWYQDTGNWKLASDGSGADSYLLYWAPLFTTYDMAVTAAITGNNGVVARFTDKNNYIEAVISGSGGSRTLTLNLVIAGSVVDTASTTISYSDGQDLTLQVANATATGSGSPSLQASRSLLVRVFYNNTMVIPTSGNVYSYPNGAATPLATGRAGIVRASGVTSSTETVASSFRLSAGVESVQPSQPSVTSKSGDATVKVSVTLSSTGFTDSDGDSHSASQWQVVDYPAGSFASPLFDSGEDVSNLTSITVLPSIGTWSAAIEGLDAATQYQARVRHKDSSGIWSEWSDAFIFTTGSPSTNTTVAQVPATYPASPPPSDSSFRRIIGFNTLVTQYESGIEQRRSKSTSGRRVFELRYDPLEKAEVDTLWDFYKDTAFGILNVFNWVHPITDEVILCRFRDDQMSREIFEAEIERTGVTLVEVLRT